MLAREGIKASREQANAAREAFSKWRDSGARGTRRLKGQDLESFLDGGWRQAALSEVDAKRARAQVLHAVGLGGQGGPGGRSVGRFVADSLGATGRAVAGQVLPHGGLGGRIAQQGVVEAAGAGGLMSGAGLSRLAAGGVIGAAAFGLIKLAGGVVSKLGAASDESMARSDMLRGMGMAVDEFDRLRSSAAALAHGLSLTTLEATQLARTYGTAAGFGQNSRTQAFGEAGEAGRFARQTGLDVAGTAGAFAQLRRVGQDTPERLGKTIVDAMSRRGDFGRMGEVVEALRAFATDVNAGSRTKANVDQALALAARLAGLGATGVGSPEALGAVASMDAGFRGGAGGEAGNLLLLGGMQRLGMPVTGYDVQSVREAGLMANLSDVFGPNSPAFLAAKASGNAAEMARLGRMAELGGGKFGMDLVHSGIVSRSASLQERASMMQTMTNASNGDANLALAAIASGGMAGVLERLRRRGIDPHGMNEHQIIAANGVLSDSQAGLNKRRRALLARTGDAAISDADRNALQSTNDPEKLRDALLKVASSETIQTEGERTRTSLATINATMEAMASKLQSLLVPIRDLLADVAKKLGWISQDEVDQIKGVTRGDKLKRAIDEDSKELAQAKASSLASFPAQAARIRELERRVADNQLALAHEGAWRGRTVQDGSGVAQGAAEAEAGRRDARVAAMAAAPSQYDKVFQAAAKKFGVDPLDLKLIAARESSMQAGAVNLNANGSEDLGIMQHNSRYLAERKLSRQDALNPEKAIPAAAVFWAGLLRRHGGDKKAAFRAYNGAGPAAEAYSDGMMRSRAQIDANLPSAPPTTLPAEAQAPQGLASTQSPAEATLQHQVAVTLRDQRGATLAQIPPIKLSDGRPAAAGTETNWAAP